MGGWEAVEGGLTTWRPHFKNPPAELRDRWTRGGANVGLYIAYYRNQSFEQKLVSSDNVLVRNDDREWLRVGTGPQKLDVAGRPVSARTEELRGPGAQRLVAWYWYWIDGKLTSSDALAKGYTALSRLVGRGDDSAVIVVYTLKGAPGEAEAALERFVREAGPAVSAMLADTRARR